MNGPLETEIKLMAAAAMLDSLGAHPALAGEETVHRLVNTWFDTPDGALHRAGATLRIRQTGDSREQTLKLAPRDGLTRIEWTVPAATQHPEPPAFPAKAQRQLARIIGDSSLRPIASATIERRERSIRHREATIAVAFDSGTITAGTRQIDIRELELELSAGPLADALALACELPLGPDLAWSARSKAARAFALAQGSPVGKRAHKPRLDPHMPAGEGFRAIAWNVLTQLLAAYPPVLADGSPVAVHQTRVALRRLRSAIRVFAPALRDQQMPVLRAALGTAARGLGQARDLHVLASAIAADPLVTAPEPDAEATAVLAHIESRLASATSDAAEILASAPFQRLLFEFALWLESGEWRSQADTPAETELRIFAAHALTRARRRLLRHGTRLSGLDEPTRHEVRKDAKQLRYAIGFLAPLWRQSASARHRTRLARDLARLQELLGTLNDLAVAQASQPDLFATADPITAARLGARLQSLLASRGESRKRLLRRAEKTLDRIAATPAWWKHA